MLKKPSSVPDKIFLALIMVVIGAGASSASAECPARKSLPQLEISLGYAKPDYNNTLSVQTLKRLSKKKFGRLHPIGLTLTTLQHSADLRFQTINNSQTGKTCTYLDRVRVRVSYVNTQVYIARKYKPGSCQFEAVLDHENTHVRIYNDSLSRAQPNIRNLIRKSLNALKPVETSAPEMARKKIQFQLEKALSASLKNMETTVSAAQKQIDTPSNYAKTEGKCRSW
ncbi:MAG: hypothetical protein OEY85_08540 [Rhodospirillales bacterium]|nr:hypothetical protein [Rhodospirillales bacterium]